MLNKGIVTKMFEVIIKTAPTWKPLAVNLGAQLGMRGVEAGAEILGNRRNIKVSKVITQAVDEEDDTLYLFSEEQGLVSRTRDLIWENTPDKDQEYIRTKFYGQTEECNCKDHKKKKKDKKSAGDTIGAGGTIRS